MITNNSADVHAPNFAPEIPSFDKNTVHQDNNSSGDRY